MGLAQAITQAKGADLTELAAYLAGECMALDRTDAAAREAAARDIAAAMSAWAYMQTRVQDQGD